MRRIILPIVILALSMHIYAQDQKNVVDYSLNMNEINIGFFNVFDMNALHEFGIGYKYKTGSGAIRIGTGFNFHTDNRDSDNYENNTSNFGISPRLGYEFHQNYNRLRLYYGADFVSSFFKSVQEESFPVIDPYETTTYTYRTNMFGLRPTLGLTVFLSKSVSLSTETYLDIVYNKSSSERESSGESNTTTSKGLDVGLGPLGIISVNIHF